MLISEDQIFTKTKAMVFSNDGDKEEKMKVVQLQLAQQWSALPKCRSLVLNLEKGVKGHWRDRCLTTVRHAKLSKWLDTGNY